MKLYGLQPLTLLDYPEHLACTVFTGGCNFACPFCHNAALLPPSPSLPLLPEADFFRFLESRKGRLEGVCVSGGEPTLHADLSAFLLRIKALGFLVKLDTNGSHPALLRRLCEERLVDYIAMDIKNAKARYAETANVPDLSLSAIEESVSFLKTAPVPYEFRTTVVRELHDRDTMEQIGRWLGGAKRYYLQTFRNPPDAAVLPSDNTAGSACSLHACDADTMREFLQIVSAYVPSAALRG